MDADWQVTPVTAQTEGPRVGAARHERQRQPLRRVRRAHGARTTPSASRRRVPRAAQPLGQPRHAARRSRSTTASWRASCIPELPQELAHLAWLDRRSRGGPGILGGDGADGPLRGGESRADSRAHRASARRRRAARHREPSQLRVARAASPARRHRSATSSCIARARRRRAPACSASSRARWARRATSSAARASPRR